MAAPLTLIDPSAGVSKHSCGYCSPPGERSTTDSSISYGVTVQQMSCETYQHMIDRGWRRSGTYAYKPDMGRTCCPQYTIRLDATQLKVSKSQKKALNKWKNFIIEGEKHEVVDADMDITPSSARVGAKPGKPRHKGKNNAAPELVASVHAAEVGHCDSAAHKFEVVLEPASYSEQKFALYNDYQQNVHHDPERTRSGFKRFLVDSPLIPQHISYQGSHPVHLPSNYGSYHQLYFVNEELVAMGVIDILPGCISSVYFMYADGWEKWSLGKISALREAALVKEMHDAGLSDLRFLYMGFYIHSCQKMRYKGEYSPSYLLDPEEYSWHDLRQCLPILDRDRYVSFAHPPPLSGDADNLPRSLQSNDLESEVYGRYYQALPKPTAGCLDPENLPSTVLDDVRVVSKSKRNIVEVQPVKSSRYWRNPTRRMICDAVATLGPDIAREVVFIFR